MSSIYFHLDKALSDGDIQRVGALVGGVGLSVDDSLGIPGVVVWSSSKDDCCDMVGIDNGGEGDPRMVEVNLSPDGLPLPVRQSVISGLVDICGPDSWGVHDTNPETVIGYEKEYDFCGVVRRVG